MTLENFIYESVSEILNGGDEEVKKDIEKHKEIYKDDTLEKMGFNLPFIVKLSHNLMLYDVLDKVYFDDVEVMKKLWG